MPVIDLMGQRFGKLTITEKLGLNAHRGMMWLCVCDCGGYTKAQTSDLRKGA
ncbi:MAG: hypothetical protein IKG23_03190 [Clostridia bacterium]|nr:hypothetical protein [Clostridia bacterium]